MTSYMVGRAIVCKSPHRPGHCHTVRGDCCSLGRESAKLTTGE